MKAKEFLSIFNRRLQAHYKAQKGGAIARDEALANLKRWFAKWKFEFLGNGIHHTAFGGVIDGAKVVVKFRSVEDTGVRFPSDEALKEYPLLARRIVRPLARMKHAMIMPRVECPPQADDYKALNDERFKNAAKVMSRWFSKLHGKDFDCHAGNIGFVGRKAMIFDPMWYND